MLPIMIVIGSQLVGYHSMWDVAGLHPKNVLRSQTTITTVSPCAHTHTHAHTHTWNFRNGHRSLIASTTVF